MKKLLVISGGQTGVDIAALRAAKSLGIKTGGYIPKGFRTEDGPRPEYASLYGLIEMPSIEYPPRTIANLSWSDITLLIGNNLKSRGSMLLRREAYKRGKPVRQLEVGTGTAWDITHPTYRKMLIGDTLALLRDKEIINVAGNRDTILEKPVEEFLYELFDELNKLREWQNDPFAD